MGEGLGQPPLPRPCVPLWVFLVIPVPPGWAPHAPQPRQRVDAHEAPESRWAGSFRPPPAALPPCALGHRHRLLLGPGGTPRSRPTGCRTLRGPAGPRAPDRRAGGRTLRGLARPVPPPRATPSRAAGPAPAPRLRPAAPPLLPSLPRQDGGALSAAAGGAAQPPAQLTRPRGRRGGR